MKVLHIIPSLQKGGAERLVLDICNNMHSRSEITCKLITFRSDNSYNFLTETIDWEVIPSKYIPSLTGKATSEIKALQKAIDAFQPDVIHSHLFEVEMIISQIQTSAKRVVHFHNNMPQLAKLSFRNWKGKQSITNGLERRIVCKHWKEHTTTAIGISKNTLTYIEKHIPSSVSKILLLNAVDTNRFEHPVGRKREARIVKVGRLDKNKGHKLAIEVIQQLHQRGHEVHFDIIGNGETHIELEKQIKHLNLEGYIHLHGFLDHPEEILKTASICIHTAYSEAFGLVLIEAMTAGLPVVTTDSGGTKDLIDQGINGYVIPNRSADMLADKIELLLENEDLRQTLGSNAQKFSQQFDIHSYTDSLIEIYNA